MKKRVAKRLEKLTLLKSSASVDDVEERKKQIRKTQNLINVNRFNATHNFANLFEALRRCDEAEFGARLLLISTSLTRTADVVCAVRASEESRLL